MTKKRLEKTPWAKRFKKEQPGLYERTIGIVLGADFAVKIKKIDDQRSIYRWIVWAHSCCC